MRRVLGWGLLLAVSLALMPFLPRVMAYVNGYVNLPAATQARYRTVSAAAGPFLLKCAVPKTITLRRATARTGLYFQCQNNFNAPVTLQWYVVDDGTPTNTFLKINGTQANTLTAGAAAACMSLTLTPGNTNATRTVYFRGVTSSASSFFAEINFSATVTVQANAAGVGDSCP